MRLLIIEDDKETREFLKLGLEERGYVVDTASDGEAGSYTARTNDYDLILLDNVLPRKQGSDVCKDIRACGKTIPILVLSARGEAVRRVELLNEGADDYMSKPFSFEELLARIRAILRRPSGLIGNVLQIDDLSLDRGKQLANRAQKEIYLTRKEFLLLECLLLNKEQVISRAMIMEHVWDIDSDPFSNTIEAHILNLRRKIDARPHKRKLIHTVPGRGYKIASKPMIM
jgi:two-component system, OmpR family, response regulator